MYLSEPIPVAREPFAPDQSSLAVVATALIGFAVVAWLALRPLPQPPPQSADAPAALFAAGRTVTDHAVLARGAASAQALAYISQRVRAIGFEPEVQSVHAQRVTRSGGASDVQAGLVHNIVVRKNGSAPDRARRPALLVAAHYDSASPGTNGAPVAAMLETLRALGQGPALANDVIFLFADAEHAGSLGAAAFARQHPLARHVGMVLQFDAAGGGGPLLLTGTRGGNGNMVAGWAKSAPQPQGSSALALLADRAPGLRQGQALDQVGSAGMRFAHLAPGSTGQATQQAGDTMLALTRYFGNLPLASIGAADQVHFDLPLAGQVHYSAHYVWPLTRMVGLMVLIACCIAVKRSGVPAGSLFAGATAFFAMSTAVALAALAVWGGAGASDGWVLLAVITLGAAVFVECQRVLLKEISLPAVLLGALLVMLTLLAGASWMLPGASYLLAWPMMGALLAYGAVQAPRIAAWPGGARLAILVAGSAPAVLLFAPLLRQMTALFAFQRSLVLVLALALMLALATAPLAALRRRFVAPLLLLACGASLMSAGRAAPHDAARAAAPLTYLKDAVSWKAWWLDDDGRRVAPAPPSAIHFPELAALRDEVQNRRRKVAFTVRSTNDSPTLEVRVEGTPTLRARLDGQLLTDQPSSPWAIRLHGTAGRLHRFELEFAPGNITRVFVQERRPGVPGATGATPAGQTIASDMLVFR